MPDAHERERRETEACLAGVAVALQRLSDEQVDLILTRVADALRDARLTPRCQLMSAVDVIFEGVAPFE